MSSAEGSNAPNFLQRASTPLFLLLALLFVPAATLVSVFLGMILCVIAGVENSDTQARIGLAALLIGFIGSIYLLIRARRSPAPQPQQTVKTASAPPPLPISRDAQEGGLSNADLTEVSGYQAIAEPESEDAFDQTQIEANRIVDWVKVFTTPVLITFNVALVSFALAALPQQTQNYKILAQAMSVIGNTGLVAAPIIFLSALTSHLLGTHFNIARDRLSYPYFAWRLALPLSAINDANAQIINKRGVDVLASLGEKTPKYKTVHHYNVNLSGDFGARRLMFRSKFKRDQFLSILRAVRPNVRITRWS